MAKAAVYHYFKGKHALLEAMHRDVFDDAAEKLARAPRFGSLRDALEFLGRGYLEHFREAGPAEVMRIALNVNGEDPELLRLSSSLVMPRMESMLDAFLRPHLPEDAPAGEARRLLLPFFGALFYYRFVLQSTCAPAQLPGEREYLERLLEAFGRPPRPAAAARTGRPPRRSPAREPKTRRGRS